jgi:N-acetylmuramoyl-L-alanine amidase
MSIFSTFYSFARRPHLIWVPLLAILTLAVPVDAKKILFDDRMGTVVLDPGHGGNDQGAVGPSGVLEKNVTLALARLIARELETDFRVTLTRTEDYGLDIFKRTGTANHEQADLFISLHTGASFLHNAKGLTIFYYQGALPETPQSDPSAPSDGDAAHTPWHAIQNRHVTQSARLAETIQKQLLAQATFIESRLQSAPLAVLEGADMPAVLIEIGYLSNPIQEKALKDPAILADYARGISLGIRAFLRK